VPGERGPVRGHLRRRRSDLDHRSVVGHAPGRIHRGGRFPGLPGLGPVPPLISAVSCASSTACVAVDRQGGYAFVGDPLSGTWTATQIDYPRPSPITGPPSLTGVSCDPSGQCVAVDGLGFAVTGQITG
jgi:hypothetical protein